MNRAMLLQQLHYNLPLQKWVDDGNGYIKLENPVERLPDIRDQNTWYGDRARYGNGVLFSWHLYSSILNQWQTLYALKENLLI